jgi:hypothetical protein
LIISKHLFARDRRFSRLQHESKMARPLVAVAALLSVLGGMVPSTLARGISSEECSEMPYKLLHYYQPAKTWCASYDGKSVGPLPPPCEEEKHDFRFQMLAELAKAGPAFASLLW